ncbi:unnamed protein product [Sphenostylis stenocarpa]|uniref:Sulfotransferase n=1 Tax=Sphenostylis stenocarpa TaxID=92480 RepID=A0AA86W5G3_9FABA|nr:unnamed protein product [Sphenostylis stenocarpa]
MALTSEKQINEENEFILSLPRTIGLATASHLHHFQEFWYPSTVIQGVYNFQKYFHAKDNDVFVASFPKSGTTWLKALTFAILNHQRFPSFENHPLLTSNPHELVPPLEFILSRDWDDQILNLSNKSEPRLLGIHTPFPSLPKSVKESNCKIIYICRNSFDTFVSAWEFFPKIKSVPLPTLAMGEAFEKFCDGIMTFGPWWSHMLGYWKENIDIPKKVLFLKYEDLKEDTEFHVKRIIEFLGCPCRRRPFRRLGTSQTFMRAPDSSGRSSGVQKTGTIVCRGRDGRLGSGTAVPSVKIGWDGRLILMSTYPHLVRTLFYKALVGTYPHLVRTLFYKALVGTYPHPVRTIFNKTLVGTYPYLVRTLFYKALVGTYPHSVRTLFYKALVGIYPHLADASLMEALCFGLVLALA